jgi:hypothetical protein
MEFASEMIIKATLWGGRISEVPIRLSVDGRTAHPPHLRTFRDGWRHLRFFLLYSPRWLFLWPGVVLIVLGVLGYAVAMPGLTLFGANFDVHTLLGAKIRADLLPLSAAGLAGAQEAALSGGDDYELLFAAPAARRNAIEHLGQRLDLMLTRIGRVEEGSDVRVIDAQGQAIEPTARGWQHF